MSKLIMYTLGFVIVMFINVQGAAANQVLTGCTSLNEDNPSISFWYGPNPPPGKPLNPIVVPFDDFIVGVVEGEIFPGAGTDPDGITAFTIENMKAQAVIARSFSFSHCDTQSAGIYGNFNGLTFTQIAYWPNRQGANYESLIGDFSRNNSYYIANSNRLTNAVDAQFKDFTHSPTTLYTAADPTSPNLVGVYDAVMHNSSYSGPAQPGYSQNGGDHWSRGRGYSDADRYPQWDYAHIMAHYYSDIQLTDFSGVVYWGDYRWNMLKFMPQNDAFYVGEPKQLTLRIQNTGSAAWPSGTRLYMRWIRTSITGNPPATGSWSQVASVSALSEGADEQLSFSLTPPSSIFINSGEYRYKTEWDLKLPAAQGGGFFKDQGWTSQEWALKLVKRFPPPTPKPTPIPPCPNKNPCAFNTQFHAVSWNGVTHPDLVAYRWRLNNPNGNTVGTGSAPSTPPLAFERGTNLVYVRTVDPNENTNISAEVVVATLIYDPDAPDLNVTPLPQWSNAQALAINWTMSDAVSGIDTIKVERQVNTGPWTTVVNSTTATSYTPGPVADGSTYRFRLTLTDKAGNHTVVNREVTIDRTPRTATLVAPTGAITTTWARLTWTQGGAGAPVEAYVLERFTGAGWEALNPRRYATGSSMIFLGEPLTTYPLRLRAIDLAGNEEGVGGSVEISFTTGLSQDGLYQIHAPVVFIGGP